jgi:hypothetical protein
MSFTDPPPHAAWQHRDSRDGFEVVFFGRAESGYRIEGHTAAVEEGEPWAVDYVIDVDPDWCTRRARVSGISATGRRERIVDADGAGTWRVDGVPAPQLDGCLDLDLESSSLTNAFPVRRFGLEVGQEADAPAAYVRALDLAVERLPQGYLRLDDEDGRQAFHYTSPTMDFECRLVYDESGLVIDYPGIAKRVA